MPGSEEVQHLLDAGSAFLVALHSNEGFQQDLYDALVNALQNCTTAWRGLDCIPRDAVGVLVDIAIVTESMAHAYAEPERQRILEAGFHLYGHVNECVNGK
jgi:hypothetical protein